MVIIRRKKKDELFNVAAQINLPPSRMVKGDIGLEIECEGNHFRKERLPAPWAYHRDGSLRGKDNAEYVFSSAQPFSRVDRAIDVLWNMFQKDETVLDDSNRTSVHVHLNVQNFYLNRLTSLIACWIILEEPLVEWCGEHRVGNLFCLRAKDAPAIVNRIAEFISSDMEAHLEDNLHYAGMNPQAIVKLGSLEFRTLRGVREPGPIKDWVKILRRLYDVSASYPDPRTLCEAFSHTGPYQFFNELLGPMSQVVRDGISFSEDQIRESMYDGVRLAQDLCYCRDWDRFKAIDLRADPFGRDLRTIKRRLDGEQIATMDQVDAMWEQAEIAQANGEDAVAVNLIHQANIMQGQLQGNQFFGAPLTVGGEWDFN